MLSELYQEVQRRAQRCVYHALQIPLGQAFLAHVNRSQIIQDDYRKAVDAYQQAGGAEPCPYHGCKWGMD
jgi:hypothetical protein